MQDIDIASTDRSPAVRFDVARGHLTIRGESYPEDAAKFFGPLLLCLRRFLQEAEVHALKLDLEMSYFNSSTAKALMNTFQIAEEAAAAGKDIVINWYFHEDDDAMREFGEDFSEDLVKARFNFCPIIAT